MRTNPLSISGIDRQVGQWVASFQKIRELFLGKQRTELAISSVAACSLVDALSAVDAKSWFGDCQKPGLEAAVSARCSASPVESSFCVSPPVNAPPATSST